MSPINIWRSKGGTEVCGSCAQPADHLAEVVQKRRQGRRLVTHWVLLCKACLERIVDALDRARARLN